MPTTFRLRPLLAALAVFTAIAATPAPAAPVTTRGLTFSLTKRNDYMLLTQVAKGYEFKVEHWDKSTDKTTVATKFVAAPQGGPEQFTLVHDGGGEVRLEVKHLPSHFTGPVPETLCNKGDWSVTISGRGPAFEKLRRHLVTHRWESDWKGAGDLTFYGSSFTTTSYTKP